MVIKRTTCYNIKKNRNVDPHGVFLIAVTIPTNTEEGPPRLVSVMVTKCVFYEVRNQLLNSGIKCRLESDHVKLSCLRSYCSEATHMVQLYT